MSEKEELDFLELDLFIEQRIVDMGLNNTPFVVMYDGDISDFSTVTSITVFIKGSYLKEFHPTQDMEFLKFNRLPDKYIIQSYMIDYKGKMKTQEYTVGSMLIYNEVISAILYNCRRFCPIYKDVISQIKHGLTNS